MKRPILALVVSPLVVPLLILAGGIRPNMMRFALTALPITYALTALAGVLVCLVREFCGGRPPLWASLLIGFFVGAGFLFSRAAGALARPTSSVYLVYAGFGVATTAVGHLIAFGLTSGSATKK